MPKSFQGVCLFFSETGTEGGYWAFQDSRYISGDQFDYKGLHLLEDGDHLTIYAKESSKKVVWSGKISLKQHPNFTQSVFRWWIHAEQEGIDREVWAKYFFDYHPAKLQKRRK